MTQKEKEKEKKKHVKHQNENRPIMKESVNELFEIEYELLDSYYCQDEEIQTWQCEVAVNIATHRKDVDLYILAGIITHRYMIETCFDVARRDKRFSEMPEMLLKKSLEIEPRMITETHLGSYYFVVNNNNYLARLHYQKALDLGGSGETYSGLINLLCDEDKYDEAAELLLYAKTIYSNSEELEQQTKLLAIHFRK